MTVVGPASLPPGSVGSWTLKTVIEHPHAELSVDIYGTTPSALSPCSAFYTGHGNIHVYVSFNSVVKIKIANFNI